MERSSQQSHETEQTFPSAAIGEYGATRSPAPDLQQLSLFHVVQDEFSDLFVFLFCFVLMLNCCDKSLMVVRALPDDQFK